MMWGSVVGPHFDKVVGPDDSFAWTLVALRGNTQGAGAPMNGRVHRRVDDAFATAVAHSPSSDLGTYVLRIVEI